MFAEFLDYLEYKKIIIVTKFHYNAKMINKETRKSKDELINNSNIIILKEEDDINYILPYLDLLISDYSSIIYDYMCMKNQSYFILMMKRNTMIIGVCN